MITMTLMLVVAITVAVIVGEAVSMMISNGPMVGYWDEVGNDLWPALVYSASLGPALACGGASRRRRSCAEC